MDNFTKTAQKLWQQIPSKARLQILNSVWCSDCRDTVTMLNVSGRVEQGDLVLQGTCEKCGQDVARLIENDCA